MTVCKKTFRQIADIVQKKERGAVMISFDKLFK